MVLVAIAAGYAAIIAAVNRHAIWDGIDVYQGRPTWFTLGVGTNTLLFLGLIALSRRAAGRRVLRLMVPSNRWRHLLPATAAGILAGASYLSSMRFPLLLLPPLAVGHAIVELLAEVSVSEAGVLGVRFFPFRDHHFYIKGDATSPWLMRRRRGEKPRRRYRRLSPDQVDGLNRLLGELQPPFGPGDELLGRHDPWSEETTDDADRSDDGPSASSVRSVVETD